MERALAVRVTERFTFNWTTLSGAKFPSGSTSHLSPDEPDFAPGIGGHDLALGSGSFDGLLGMEVLRAMEAAVCERSHAVRGAQRGGFRLPICQ